MGIASGRGVRSASEVERVRGEGGFEVCALRVVGSESEASFSPSEAGESTDVSAVESEAAEVMEEMDSLDVWEGRDGRSDGNESAEGGGESAGEVACLVRKSM